MIRFLPTTSPFLHRFRWLTPYFEGNHNIFLSDTILLKTQKFKIFMNMPTSVEFQPLIKKSPFCTTEQVYICLWVKIYLPNDNAFHSALYHINICQTEITPSHFISPQN